MAFAIATAHNIISSCCGDNNISNPFTKDEEDQAEVVAPTPTPAPVVKTKPAPVVVSKEFSDKDAKFEDIPWAKLPISARKAAKVIGFAEESWDGKEWLGESYFSLILFRRVFQECMYKTDISSIISSYRW